MIRAQCRFVLKRNILFKLLYLLALMSIVPLSIADSAEPAIVVNQAGYLPDWPKRALIIDRPNTSIVTLRDAESDALIMMIKPKQVGYADLCPFTEFGDAPLEVQLSNLLNEKHTPILQRSLLCAKLDAEARFEKRSLYLENRIKNHFLITDLLNCGNTSFSKNW